MIVATLVYLFRGNEVLLGMKKRGFGMGKWNGPGGKLKDGETIKQAAIRETEEEIEVTPELGEPLGRIHFFDSDQSEWMGYVFRTDVFYGEPTESEELRPQWFPLDSIPYDDCWSDDRYWFPHLIANQPFEAEIWLAKDGSVAKHDIRLISRQ